MPNLPFLPEDVFFCMAKHIEISDLHNVRLASRAWRKPAAKSLFKRVYLSSHERDIEYFEKITSNPELVVYVEELIVDESTFNRALLDFEAFLYLTDVHPANCPHDDPEYLEYKGDAGKNREWHERTARECDHDTARIRERQIETAERVFKWLQEEIEKHWANRTTHRDFTALLNALRRGLRIKRWVRTSLPFDPTHDDRPDQPYEPPNRSPAVRQWEQEVPDSGGLVRRSEILPKVGWQTPDSFLSQILFSFSSGDETELQELSYSGIDFRQWKRQHEAGHGPACYHPIAVMSPYRGLMLGLKVFAEASTELSELSVIPSGRGHPPCCKVGLGMSAAIFLTRSPAMERLLRLVGQVRVLRLVLEPVFDQHGTLPGLTDRHGHLIEYPGLNRTLQTGHNVEELYLHFVNEQVKAVDINFLRDLRPNRLRQIHLHDVCFTDVNFFCFVHENRHSLRELVVFYCTLLEDHESWWWPMLDELRKLGCLRGMDVYINNVHQTGQTLEMDGDPKRREGVARWTRWIADGERFPLSASKELPEAFSPGRVPAGYRDRLRAALAPAE